MAGFSIDDVRGTFSTDISGLIAQISEAAQVLASEPLLAGESARDQRGRPAFEAIADHGHTIAGTSGLVRATGLAETARVLEDLAAAGGEAMRQAERHAASAARIGELCAEGARVLARVLDFELRSQP